MVAVGGRHHSHGRDLLCCRHRGERQLLLVAGVPLASNVGEWGATYYTVYSVIVRYPFGEIQWTYMMWKQGRLGPGLCKRESFCPFELL